MKFCFLDFEFHSTNERHLDVVSVAWETVDSQTAISTPHAEWIYNTPHTSAGLLRKMIDDGVVFVAYVLEAETRAMLSLGVDVSKMKGIDLYVEYRRLLNHNHALSYGNQYIDGRVIRTSPPPPKWERDADSDSNEAHHKPQYSLAAATYKLLHKKIDTDRKNKMRDIIISRDADAIEAHRNEILEYNVSDIADLSKLLKVMVQHDRKLLGVTHSSQEHVEPFISGALVRGDYSIRSARMISLGYPVNMEKVSKFEKNIDAILQTAIKDVQYSTVDFKPFNWDTGGEKYTLNVKGVQGWIEAQNLRWRKTDKQAVSYSYDAFKDWFDQHSPGFPGAFCRYLKTKKSLNGFIPSATSTKGVFRDFVGTDGRARPFMGLWGSQSSRSQPGAVGFIPLKSHWMRNFIEAPHGRALFGIDYASQEFLIAALLSQDADMMASYAEGDVYLAFGKRAGLIPPHGTKATHPVEREVCKQCVLGISYDMTGHGLAPRISRVTGKPFDVDDADDLIKLFYETYDDYGYWKRQQAENYRASGWAKLPDGWTMWGDNWNERSVGNFPVQGHGAVIMRRAVAIAQDDGVDVIFTLHDALYAEAAAFDFESVRKLRDAMVQAFDEVMAPYGKTQQIRTEGETWSKNYTEKTACPIENIACMSEYVDAKGFQDLQRFKIYFT